MFGADLSGATFSGADLSQALLNGADLRRARGLTREQVGVAVVDGTTRLPDLPSASPGATPTG